MNSATHFFLFLQASMDEKFACQATIENHTRAYKLQCAKFDEEVNTAKAQAQLAYELEVAKIQQKIRTEQIKIDVIVRKKQIEIEEEEVKRKDYQTLRRKEGTLGFAVGQIGR